MENILNKTIGKDKIYVDFIPEYGMPVIEILLSGEKKSFKTCISLEDKTRNIHRLDRLIRKQLELNWE